MTSLWRNFSGKVFANRSWVVYVLLISAPIVHWRVQPTAARRSGRFNKMHVRALHVSLSNASMRTVHWWLKRKKGHLITLQNWIPLRYHVWGAMHEAILIPSSEDQNSFWNKSRTGEDMEQFSAGPVNKAVPSFRNSLTESTWRMTEDILSIFLYSKVSTLAAFMLSRIVEAIFDDVSAA